MSDLRTSRNGSLVFLCGPITGVSVEQSEDWRRYSAAKLAPDIGTLDPTRELPDRKRRSTSNSSTELRLHRIEHGKAMVARDRFDVGRCDLLLANFLGAQSVSVGAVGEIFWADLLRKPIIVVREESGNPHDHDQLNELADWVLGDLDEAIEKSRLLLASHSRG